ncbi:MAG: AraC family transcriptional regulator [Bacteroidota bacterium]|nr:AraC family transcriptional regulator [Bacteroidota bacterium]
MKKEDGFRGQKSISVPATVLEECRNDNILNRLFVTHIGFYPKADQHLRERPEGCEQNILIYCIDGAGWFSTPEHRYKVEKGQFFILPSGLSHNYGADERNPWTIFWIHFEGSNSGFFVDAVPRSTQIPLSPYTHQEDRIELFEDIFQNLEMGYSQDNLYYANISLWHFLASLRFINQFRQIRKVRTNDVVEESIYHMRDNVGRKLSLHDLASMSGLSTSHFSMLFRKKTGRAPLDYFTHLKIQRACQFLDSTDLRIKEICVHLGYDDPYYFSRIFTKTMGVSPIIYRRQMKG